MLIMRLKSKETHEIQTNMTKTELINKLIKYKITTEETEGIKKNNTNKLDILPKAPRKLLGRIERK